eukprot:TRINITY_DN21764_c0_g1_i1.p1 TRINITY_DN21764_c0_g1~~TRINITY_DN21764_c0_g1_i1.p1  ORF type:complete len:139 (+),score=33.36 TRINITY_DN21764_c0_g1_i1:170-586(+)
MEELRKNNTNPIFQQYISISEENARLNKELNLLKYKVTDLQEAHDNMKRIYEENKVGKKASTRSLKNIHSEKTELIARNKTLEEELEKIKIKLDYTEQQLQFLSEQNQELNKKVESQESTIKIKTPYPISQFQKIDEF